MALQDAKPAGTGFFLPKLPPTSPRQEAPANCGGFILVTGGRGRGASGCFARTGSHGSSLSGSYAGPRSGRQAVASSAGRSIRCAAASDDAVQASMQGDSAARKCDAHPDQVAASHWAVSSSLVLLSDAAGVWPCDAGGLSAAMFHESRPLAAPQVEPVGSFTCGGSYSARGAACSSDGSCQMVPAAADAMVGVVPCFTSWQGCGTSLLPPQQPQQQGCGAGLVTSIAATDPLAFSEDWLASAAVGPQLHNSSAATLACAVLAPAHATGFHAASLDVIERVLSSSSNAFDTCWGSASVDSSDWQLAVRHVPAAADAAVWLPMAAGTDGWGSGLHAADLPADLAASSQALMAVTDAPAAHTDSALSAVVQSKMQQLLLIKQMQQTLQEELMHML